MTYKISNVLNIISVSKGTPAPTAQSYGVWGDRLYRYTIGCHYGHYLEFLVTLICYNFAFPIHKAHQIEAGWILEVIGFNIAVELVLCNFWHWMTYVSPYARSEPMKERKFNQENQYEPSGVVGFLWSSTGNLQREVLFTTLGWLQSSALQCLFMHLWATGRLPYHDVFFKSGDMKHNLSVIGSVLFITYWREFHFYWCHRMIHPWRWEVPGIGDIGKFMYKHFHSLHHKSYNPGPWSGLSMHPVEHFFYYSCTWVAALIKCHPIMFLYAKFHADIAPIGGHDGHQDPAGNGDFHYLHHAKFECNYGVPLIDFDRLFGTWVDYAENKAAKEAKQNKSK
eukprot:CAMPEP_0197847882 /NCGR_PEP_ID=MMETSP1438-20131217/7399_1 /TAXON_ID=1461541 /ORGANISM="Pterosperma sp., Strain CCMP1384" /LENGTH=337 /DNA_ID=CAMNT_0043459945 /DNA_START=47 /DNA_END=1060 /DNA_ORIENTATION=-